MSLVFVASKIGKNGEGNGIRKEIEMHTHMPMKEVRLVIAFVVGIVVFVV